MDFYRPEVLLPNGLGVLFVKLEKRCCQEQLESLLLPHPNHLSVL